MRDLKPLETAVAVAVGVISCVAAIIGASWAMDERWTPRVMFAGFQQQYQVDRNVDLLDRTNDRLREIKRGLKKAPKDFDLLEEREELLERKDRLKNKIDKSTGG